MWSENELDLITLCPSVYMNEVLNALLHTLLFTRAPGPIKPCASHVIIKPSHSGNSTYHPIYNLKYAHCGKVPSVTASVQRAIETVVRSSRNHSSSDDSASSFIIVSFFERKVKPTTSSSSSSSTESSGSKWIGRTMMLLGAGGSGTGPLSQEEKVYWEQWVLPLSITKSKKVDLSSVEKVIQKGMKQIFTMVQQQENIPSSMYEFEIHHVRDLKEKDALYRSMLPS